MRIEIEPGVRLFVDIEGPQLAADGARLREKPALVLLHGARHPHHPAKLVLSSTSPRMNLERKLAMFEHLGGTDARTAAAAFRREPNPATWAVHDRVCKPHDNSRAADPDAAARIVFNEAILSASAGGEQQSTDLLPGLAAARCPVLVMAGAPDPVCPLDDTRDIAAALPPQWSRLALFEQSGHGAWRDEPDAAFVLLREFVAGNATGS